MTLLRFAAVLFLVNVGALLYPAGDKSAVLGERPIASTEVAAESILLLAEVDPIAAARAAEDDGRFEFAWTEAVPVGPTAVAAVDAVANPVPAQIDVSDEAPDATDAYSPAAEPWSISSEAIAAKLRRNEPEGQLAAAADVDDGDRSAVVAFDEFDAKPVIEVVGVDATTTQGNDTRPSGDSAGARTGTPEAPESNGREAGANPAIIAKADIPDLEVRTKSLVNGTDVQTPELVRDRRRDTDWLLAGWRPDLSGWRRSALVMPQPTSAVTDAEAVSPQSREVSDAIAPDSIGDRQDTALSERQPDAENQAAERTAQTVDVSESVEMSAEETPTLSVAERVAALSPLATSGPYGRARARTADKKPESTDTDELRAPANVVQSKQATENTAYADTDDVTKSKTAEQDLAPDIVEESATHQSSDDEESVVAERSDATSKRSDTVKKENDELTEADKKAETAAPQVAKSDQGTRSVAAASGGTGSDDSVGAQYCLRVGPFFTNDVFEQATTKLDRRNVNYTSRSVKPRQISAIRVFAGPYKDKNDLEVVQQRLAELQIRDYYVMEPETGGSLVSMGLFSTQASADEMISELAEIEFGVRSRREERKLSATQWIEIGDTGVSAAERDTLINLNWGDNRVRVREISCAGKRRSFSTG